MGVALGALGALGALAGERKKLTEHSRCRRSGVARASVAIRFSPVKMPNRLLESLLPAAAKEARDYPSPPADDALTHLLAVAVERELYTAIRVVRAILETPAGPEGPAVLPDPVDG